MKLDTLRIEPLDIISIRDGRPFQVGGNHLARALWPPSPWTVLGALRTLLLNELGVDLHHYSKAPEKVPQEHLDVVGPHDGPPGFRVGPVLLYRSHPKPFESHVWVEGSAPRGGGPLFPPPMDLFFAEKEATHEPSHGPTHEQLELSRFILHSAHDLEHKGYSASLPTPFVLIPPDSRRPQKPPAKWGLTAAGLAAYLQGRTPLWANTAASRPSSEVSGEASRPQQSVLSEARVGIATRDGVAEEGMIYTRRGYALAPGWSLVVPLLAQSAQHPLPNEVKTLEGTLRLGGDGHLARVNPQAMEVMDSEDEYHPLPFPQPAPGEAKAVLYFPGYTPADSLTDEVLTRLVGEPVRVMAVATSRSQPIGGWKMALHGPRDMKRYLPPGTVAHVDGSGTDIAGLHGRSIATDPEEAAAGFGWCLVGAPHPEEDEDKEQQEAKTK